MTVNGNMEKLTVFVVIGLATCFAQKFSYDDFKDFLQIGGDVDVKEIARGRGARDLQESFEDGVENFLKSNEVTINVPFNSKVTMSARSLDNGEVDLKLSLNSDKSEVQARKKSKIKKVLAPILIVLLLKAITLIPLALGLLGIKTWNALQLSFFSFVTSLGLAVWKLSTKFSDHHHAPHIVHESIHDVHVPHHDHHVVHHDPWDHHYHRSDENAQQMAFNGWNAPEAKL